ncbi:MarR family winged helix-turn-helix transcriptional regulator [Streptomyces sp. Qhu-G9]|uniref:MarR family winged helix-turn-helix transcriptional regulator n=1 Tax=Streptomyces sp. Qhu-G9 TaxID=3452799 RepID=UPI002F2B4F53
MADSEKVDGHEPDHGASGTPRPPATPTETLSAMDHVIATSMVAQQEMAQRLNLNVSDLTCFGYVLEAGEELPTAGDLASRLHVTTGAMTGIVNRLERAGYVTRRPDPADRRRVRIAATPAAVARVTALYGPYYARLAEQFGAYSPAEIAVLNDWFTRTGKLMTDYLDEVRQNPSP